MDGVALPTRTGPANGTFAFTEDGERQIYEAVRIHGMSPVKVAAQCDTSVVTVYAIIRRVSDRLGAQAA